MTEYFEVEDRDGAARIASLRLSDPLRTPALVDDVLVDGGSLWPEDRDEVSGDEESLTVLPHRGFPGGTADEVEEAFAVDYPDVDFPSAAVVTPDTAQDYGADVYVLSGAPSYAGYGKSFVEAIINTREAIPADTGLYLSGVATPANVPTLAYAGVDLVDTDRAYVRGLEGMFQTADGEYFLEDLQELPCACPACQTAVEDFDREDCAEHNVNALTAQLRTVRERIRAGELRDYVEAQSGHEQWLKATMRGLDQQYGYVEARTPLFRRAEITAASVDTMRRVEIQRFAQRVTERYRSRFDNPLVLVPCSAAKPYSESQSHGQFHDAIRWRGHVASITSPIGVVPQELELTYPAQHYDSVVTGHWSATEIEFVADVLESYLERNDYPKVIAHVPPEGYREICERVADSVDVEFEFTVDDHPTTDDSLIALSEALEGYETYQKRERQVNTLRAVADYQFGDGAGEELFPDISIGGRYPSLRANDADGEQLATLVPQYGTLSLTLAGARRWIESDAPVKRVEIDDFVPHGSALAPGIIDADDEIREGDEVVVEGPSAFAVGRAEMHGEALVESTRGAGVDVRHVEER
jgi:archaeosine synthase